jgi:SAM-dependent methyltransferase
MKRNSLSALDAIRAELQTCTDPIERVNLARRCRELPGSMFELVSELPDAETARRKLRTEKDRRAQDLGKEYQQRFAALAPYRDSVWQVLVRDFLQHYVDPSATVLDLGSGWGEFIRHIHAHRRIAMDLNPDMPSRVGSGVEVILQDCSQTWQVADSSLDVVFTSNFFEHLPDRDALRRTLQEALRCLKDGGRIICLGPNIRFLHGAYWDFWDHFLPLTDRSMIEILTLTGFALERVEPRFLPYSMSQGFTPPIGFITLYLRLPFLWRILGKQFLLVARKA